MKEQLRILREFIEDLGGTTYDGEFDDIGQRSCCYVLSYKPHAELCPKRLALDVLEQIEKQEPVAWVGHTPYGDVYCNNESGCRALAEERARGKAPCEITIEPLYKLDDGPMDKH